MKDITKQNNEYKEIRAIFDPGNVLSDQQIGVFLHIAKERKLDPRLSQICLIPRFSSVTKRHEISVIVQIDGFRLVADRTGCYAPGKDTEFYYDKNNRLLSAKAFVRKKTSDGEWHEFGETAHLAEYSTNKGLWRTMPHVMIAKCAEARALRRAFPGETSGLYVKEEMDQANVETVGNPVDNRPKELSAGEINYLNDLLDGASVEWGYKILERIKAKGYTVETLPRQLYEISIKFLEERQAQGVVA